MKFKDYVLNEERLNNNERSMIIGIIKNPKNSKISLKSYTKNRTDKTVDIKTINNGIQLEYNTDLFDFTAALADIVDGMGGYKFSSNVKGNMTVFKIMLKGVKGR